MSIHLPPAIDPYVKERNSEGLHRAGAATARYDLSHAHRD